MRKMINQVKKFGSLLNEDFKNDEKQNLEILGAVISTEIGNEILKQGFHRVERRRGSTYFINVFENGINIVITTQVHFASSDLQVFFKIQLEGSAKTSTNKLEKDRINNEYNSLFSKIINKIKEKQNSGSFKDLVIDFNLEFFVDKI